MTYIDMPKKYFRHKNFRILCDSNFLVKIKVGIDFFSQSNIRFDFFSKSVF